MKVMIMRHGYAGNKIKDDDDADLDRELTSDGKAQVKALAQHLEDNDMVPDAIFASPVKRTMQTAQILADHFFGSPKAVTIDQNLAENKPIEMALVARTQDKKVKRPLLVSHSGNIERLSYLKGKYKPAPDPMSTSEVRVLKVKRGDVDPGGKGVGPTADWKEKQRILPSDVDEDAENLY